MKLTSNKLILSLFLCMTTLVGKAQNTDKTWVFKNISAQDKELMSKDNALWQSNTDNAGTYYTNIERIGKNGNITDAASYEKFAGALKADKQELSYAKGLLFTIKVGDNRLKAMYKDNVRLYDGKFLKLNTNGLTIVIPGLKAGDQVIVHSKSASSKDARYLQPTNLNVTAGFAAPELPASKIQESVGTVIADGPVTLTAVNGNLIYDITVKDKSGKVLQTPIVR